MSRTAEVKEYMDVMLTEKLDGPLKDHGFARRKRSTVYAREMGEARQTIDMAYDVGPRYAKEADAHLLPKLRIWFAGVNEIALRMAAGNEQVVSSAGATLFEPIDMVAPNAETPRWLPAGGEGFIEIGDDVRSFIERWVIPFLDEYQTVEAFVRGYEKSDWRLLLMQHSYVYIAAAYVVLNAPEKAREVITVKLGAPGLRKLFAPVFDYFEREATVHS
ncbi:MAG TPA: hypothetical protein VN181_00080 [Thermoanaerobaculia bacterium]|nr:hypothetical protein [Thermoanaerobaculia bacterium]